MRKIKYHANYGFAGTYINREIEVEDDVTNEEIEEEVKELVLQVVDWDWEETE